MARKIPLENESDDIVFSENMKSKKNEQCFENVQFLGLIFCWFGSIMGVFACLHERCRFFDRNFVKRGVKICI